jgi:two-component system chemotaxis response regulator CheY
MDILFQRQQAELLQFLPRIKAELKAWLFVDIRLNDKYPEFSITDAAALVAGLFKDKEGKLHICNSKELLMVIKTGTVLTPPGIVKDIKEKLPPGSCEANTFEPTAEGMAKLEIIITYKKPVHNSSYAELRRKRTDNVILIADDDKFIRSVVRKMVEQHAKVAEAIDGKEVMDAYLEFVPDILLLDIHLPGIDGKELLRMIVAVDSEAYIVMMSADSSMDNVRHALQNGAKGFLAKPLQKDKMLELVNKCPTMTK